MWGEVLGEEEGETVAGGQIPLREDVFRDHGSWHPLVRVLCFGAVFAVAYLLLMVPVLVAFVGLTLEPNLDPFFDPATPEFTIGAWAQLAAGVFAVTLLTAKADRQSLRAVGLWFHRGWATELLGGLGLGFALILLFFLVVKAFGLAHVGPSPAGAGRAVAVAFGALVPMAVFEEIAFRGYVLRNLTQAFRAPAALIMMSALFALGHLWNPEHNGLAMLNIALAGVLLAVPYLRTGSLWFACGLHFAWNATQGTLLGMPVSGLGVPGLVHTLLHQPDWLSGGPFGHEGSILATLLLLAGLGYVARRRQPGWSNGVME